jgi:hypothetical protein
MILDLATGFSRSTLRSNSKCREGQFCCNYFQKNFVAHRKDVFRGALLTGSQNETPDGAAMRTKPDKSGI